MNLLTNGFGAVIAGHYYTTEITNINTNNRKKQNFNKDLLLNINISIIVILFFTNLLTCCYHLGTNIKMYIFQMDVLYF